MAEATVTVKLSPKEFDLVREAIGETHDHAKKASVDQTLTAGARQKLRTKALLLSDISKKLGQ